MDLPVRLGILKAAGAILLGVGVLLLAASGAYYAYGAVAKSKQDELSYTAERPSLASPGYLPRPSHDSAVSSADVSNGAEAQPRDEVTSPQAVRPPEVSPGETQVPVLVSRPDGETDEGRSGAVGPPEADGSDVASPTQVAAAGDTSEEASEQEEAPAKADLVGAPISANPDAAAQAGPSEKMGAEAGGELPTPVAGTASSGDVGGGEAVGPPALPPPPDAEHEEVEASHQETPTPPASSLAPFDALKAEVAKASGPTSIDLAADPGPATHISIPLIRVNSTVEALERVFQNDSYEWETPKHIVGHIPTTALPGEQGEGWYFGHLGSPIKGEGSVFRRLPELAKRFVDAAREGSGESFRITLKAEDLEYVYQVYKTGLVPREEFRITDSGYQDITLVACYPSLYYDHRLLVTAALVEVRGS